MKRIIKYTFNDGRTGTHCFEGNSVEELNYYEQQIVGYKIKEYISDDSYTNIKDF